jgi:hypothetical protein
MGIGIVAGTLFGGTWILLSMHFENGWPDWLAVLNPMRRAEWSLLTHFFFDRGRVQRARDLKFAAFGSLWSLVLGAVGIAPAFVAPGGYWIC